MKSLRLVLVALATLLGLTGCFQVEKVVKVKPDGSGTVEETVLFTKAALASFQQMAASVPGNKEGAAKAPDIYDEAKLKDAAAKMGAGVTFVSAQKISNEQGEGFTATYAFSDINKLTIDQNPGEAVPTGNVKASSDKREPIVFHFTKGTPAELTLTTTPPNFQPRKVQPPGMEDMAMKMMKKILQDMHLSLVVEVQGTILETNAEYHDGPCVTLLDLDFNKVLADPEKFQALARANPQTLQDAKALIKGLDGVKIETAPEVKIKFQ